MIDLLLIAYVCFVVYNVVTDPDPWSEKLAAIGFLFGGAIVWGIITWIVPAASFFLWNPAGH